MSPGRLKTAPDVFVIGAMKAGTTTMYELLAEVSGVSVAEMKETDAYVSDINAEQAPDFLPKQFGDPSDIWVDISPNYTKRTWFDGVAKRIRDANPDAKLIFMARDPVERAISHYRHIELVERDVPPLSKFFNDERTKSFIEGSKYAWQLEPFLNIFPKENFLFIEFEAFVADPTVYEKEIGDFIGLGDDFKLPTKAAEANASVHLGKLPPWWNKVRHTRFIEHLRRFLSRQQIDKIKAIFTFGRKARKPSRFTDEIRHEIAKILAEDTAKFKEISGLKGENWRSV